MTILIINGLVAFILKENISTPDQASTFKRITAGYVGHPPRSGG